MRTRLFFATLFIWLLSAISIQAQSYDQLWKEAEKLKQEDRPQSALEASERIFHKAEREKDYPQKLKAFMFRMGVRHQLSANNFFEDMEQLENMIRSSSHPVEKALLHSLIAEQYGFFLTQNIWKLMPRTAITKDVPQDMRKWTSNILLDKIDFHNKAALADSTGLLKEKANRWQVVINQKEIGRLFHNDLYHLLGKRAIVIYDQAKELATSLSPQSDLNKEEPFTDIDKWKNQQQTMQGDYDFTGEIIRLYRNLLTTYNRQGNDDGTVLLTLDLYQWFEQNSYSRDSFLRKKSPIEELPYLKALNRLIVRYGKSEVTAEAYLKKARLFQQNQLNPDALETLEEGIKRYGSYFRINALKEMKEEILQPFVQISLNERIYPSDTVKVEVAHSNANGFSIKLHRLNLPADHPLLSGKEIPQSAITETISHTFNLEKPTDYTRKDTTFYFIAPGKGLWLPEITTDPAGIQHTQSVLSATTLRLTQHGLPDKQVEFIVTDSKSGAPVEEARIILYGSENDDRHQLGTIITDKEGRAVYSDAERVTYARAETDEDRYMQIQRAWTSGAFRTKPEQDNQKVQLLTDRAIYRPGQTVFLKGIAYAQQGDTAQVLTKQDFVVRLLDANNREVGRKELTSNDYGSFTTEFILPGATLNGAFTIEVNNNRIWIQVEEYKRPSFTVNFDPQEKSYQLGDRISLTGEAKTYSGVPLANTPVQFTVNRMSRSWWRPIQTEPYVLLLTGDTITDDSGKFELTFDLKGAENHNPMDCYYHFITEATVTISAGETQSATTTLSAGSRSLVLDSDLPYDILKENITKTVFSASNLNGQPIATTVTYEVYRKEGKEVLLTGTAESNTPIELPEWQDLPSGEYKLRITASDEQGRIADLEREFTFYSLHDTRPPVTTPKWAKAINDSFDHQSPATLLFGTSEEDVWLYYDLFSSNKRLESRLIHLSDTVLRFDYPYKDEYKDGLYVSFMFIKNNEMYNHSFRINKRIGKKDLELNWEVFRDKLRPGQSEEWRLTVKTPGHQPADAELLALLYDASLDQFKSNRQELNVYYNPPYFYSGWSGGYSSSAYYTIYFRPKQFAYAALDYNLLFWNSDSRFTLANEGIPVQGDMVMEEETVFSIQESGFGVGNLADIRSKMADNATTELRTGFAETAFFYPQLRTDEKGEVVLHFTLPESLTQWNFRGYAHTKGMLTGMLTGKATASKEFMLSPNLPRYLRAADETVLAASVINRSEKRVAGTVTLQLFDPETEEIVKELKQPFSAEAGKTIAVRFTYIAEDQYNLLGCRMVAQGDGFSDGEQHLLPVLSNKQWVTETRPFSLSEREHQRVSFTLNSLFNKQSESATNRTLTVELTANPIWYAIQALPMISNPVNDDAISQVSAWFANSLAGWILNTTPGVKQMVEIWQKEGGTSETLWSNLQKNSDLKSTLLAETPWVLQAEKEEEQKQRLALLFDLNTLRNNNRAALDKLKELQFSGSGWAWYKGMSQNIQVTQFVVECLARLPLLTGEPLEEEAFLMLNQAMNFLHTAARREYDGIRERESKGEAVNRISFNMLFYLYLAAIAPETDGAEEAQVARDYFINRLTEDNSRMNISEKSWAAIVLDRVGRKEEASRFIISIREYLTASRALGMYFDTPWGWRWANLRIPRHLKAMEAIRLVSDDKAVLNEMTIWLLKQKQTQAWSSSINTVEAVYEIVAGNREIASRNNVVTATIGEQHVNTEDGTPGLHYIKQSFTDSATVNQKEVEIRKEGAGVAWGAIYAQYMEETDRLQTFNGGFNVTKDLYVERLKDNQAQLHPIESGTVLRTGDKVVVRLAITLDRDMDFVQLKDSRASCLEPLDNLSGYRYSTSTGYYMEIKDASTHFFFDRLEKGVHVLEYSCRVNREGSYSAGTATVQSVYAPEFSAHSDAKRIVVE